MSKFYISIINCLNNRRITEPFKVKDINEKCNDLLIKSPSFLSKHRKDNPGGYTEYFERVKDLNGNDIRGLYKILNI